MGTTFTDWKGECLAHYGVKGMRWGIRRYQNKDGSLTEAGQLRAQRKLYKAVKKEVRNDRRSSSGHKPSPVTNQLERMNSDIAVQMKNRGKLSYQLSRKADSMLKRATKKGANQNDLAKYEKAADAMYREVSVTYDMARKEAANLLGKYGSKKITEYGHGKYRIRREAKEIASDILLNYAEAGYDDARREKR